MGKLELEALLSKYNSEMGWATIAVAMGIFGEYISHFAFSRDEKRSRAEWICTVLFAVFVLGGVVGEWRFGEALSDTTGKLQRIADKEVSDARELAATEGLKRVELENRILDVFGPRRITEEQSTRVIKKLSGLARTKIDVYVFALGNPFTPTESHDSLALARAITSTLLSAHMDAEGWLLESCSGGSASNLVITVSKETAEDMRAASVLIDAFKTEVGTYPEMQEYSVSQGCQRFSDLDNSRPNKRKHDANISITVGRKINPLLTRDMLEPTGQKKP